jgi:hypothetical protein
MSRDGAAAATNENARSGTLWDKLGQTKMVRNRSDA